MKMFLKLYYLLLIFNISNFNNCAGSENPKPIPIHDIPNNTPELLKELAKDVKKLLCSNNFYALKEIKSSSFLIEKFSKPIQQLKNFEILFGKNAYLEAELIIKYLLKDITLDQVKEFIN